MRESKLAACRTKSLPTEGRSGIKSRKVKPRVSFSSLPPAKIEFESDNGLSPTDKNAVLNARISQIINEKSSRRGFKRLDITPAKQELTETVGKVKNEGRNDLDSVNEMLMDIIEEIEAENVTIEDCLRDAVMLEVLGIEKARQVLPYFVQDKKFIPWDENNNNTNFFCESKTLDCNDDCAEKPIDKLLDVFSTLKTEDLSRCCKYTLGKLCQLTSYEDYENVQKIAANSRRDSENGEEAPKSRSHSEETCNTSTTSDYPDDTDVSCLSSGSSENFEFSSLDSEKDFVVDGESAYRSQSDIMPQLIENRNNIQDAIPALIDEGVLKPRQAWSIMESGDNEKMLKRFMEEVSASFGEKAMRRFTKNREVEVFSAGEGIQNRNVSLEMDHGYCSNHSESETGQFGEKVDLSKSKTKRTSLSSINVSRKFGKHLPSSARPFTIAPARSRSRKDLPKTSTPERSPSVHGTFRDSESTSDDAGCFISAEGRFLEAWCVANDLPPSTADQLLCRGCSGEEDVMELKSTDVDELDELSWSEKGRLWIAMECLRLDRMYLEYRDKLNKCARTLQSLTS